MSDIIVVRWASWFLGMNLFFFSFFFEGLDDDGEPKGN